MPKKKYSKKLSHTQSWRCLKKKSKLKRRLKLFSIALLALFSTGILLSLFNLWQQFVRPGPASASGELQLSQFYQSPEGFSVFLAQRVSTADGKWIIKDPKIMVVSKTLRKITIFTLPSDLKLETEEFGEISVASFHNLLFMRNAQPLLYLENALKIPIEGLFISEDGLLTQDLGEASFLKLQNIFGDYLPHKDKVITNISIAKLIDTSLLFNGLIYSDLKVLDWDLSLASAYIAKEDFLKESLRVEFLNGAAINGLAFSEAQKIEPLGVKTAFIGVVEESPYFKDGGFSQNTLLIQSKRLEDLETVKYLLSRYRAVVKIIDDCRASAVLVLVHEP